MIVGADLEWTKDNVIDAPANINEKYCKSCDTWKSVVDFHLDKTHSDGMRTECKSCRRARVSQEQRLADIERVKGYKRKTFRSRQNTHLKWAYGIDLAAYEALLHKQGGVCAICQKPEVKKNATRLCIDHNHQTGEIRGLLCHKCNSAIGKLGDSPALVAAALRYLMESKS